MDLSAQIKNVFVGAEKVPLSPLTRVIAISLAVPLALFQVWLALFANLPPSALGVAFLVPLYIIALLTTSGRNEVKAIGLWEYALAFLVALSGFYLLSQSERLSGWILGLSEFNIFDLASGVVLVFVTFVLMKRCVGLGITLVVAVLLSYALLGHLLPGLMFHRKFEFDEIIEQAVISANGGLFGTPIAAAAAYVYLFVVFGKLLEVSGGGQFFFNLASLVIGRKYGGVAKVSVFSSGLFGMISGSPTADIMTTGSVTVPMMKKSGYPPYMAAAIETVSSIGGSLLPPVMGAVVFILVEFTGIGYGEVVKSSIIVAALYYLAIYFQVHNYSMREQIGRIPEDKNVSVKKILITGWPYIIPLGTLVYMIEGGWTPQRAAATAIGLTIVLSWFNPERTFRIDPTKLLNAILQATVMMSPLVAAVAGAGLVELTLNVTGLASKISELLFVFSGGYSGLVLVVAAIITIVFGMGMPTPAVYALAAVLLAPAMIQSGFGELQSHLFLVWFSIASHITPPVAVAAYVAATVAGAGPTKVANTCVKLGLLAFLMPFVFAYRPGLLLDNSWPNILLDIGVTAASIYILSGALVGYALARLGKFVRLGLAALAMIALFSSMLPILSLAAVILGIAIIVVNSVLNKKTVGV